MSAAEKKRISLFFWFLWHDSWQIKKSHKLVLEWLFVYFEQIGRKSNMKNPVWPKKSCGFYFILYSCCIPTHFIFRTLYSPFRAMDSCDSNSIIHFVKLWKICSIEKKDLLRPYIINVCSKHSINLAKVNRLYTIQCYGFFFVFQIFLAAPKLVVGCVVFCIVLVTITSNYIKLISLHKRCSIC